MSKLDQFLLPRLSRRQEQLLRFLGSYFFDHSDYPTHREIARALGLKSNNPNPYLVGLEAKGYISRDRRSPRNLRITDRGYTMLMRMGIDGQLTLNLPETEEGRV